MKVRGRGTYDGDKPPLIGMVSRLNGEIRLTPSRTVRSEDILKKAIKNIDDEASIYHDDYKSYSSLEGAYRHETVNHSVGEYSREGGIHTNTIEGEFSVFRPWWATYRGVSKEHAYLYSAQYQFLRNTKHQDRVQRATSILLPTIIERWKAHQST